MTQKPDKDGPWQSSSDRWNSLKPRARELRSQQTSAERLLWGQLRKHKRQGFKFRPQQVIDRFIVDFYCAEANLIIEVDGEVHKFTAERDEQRQKHLEAHGYQVLRFSNDEVNGNLRGVLAMIDDVLQAKS